MRWILGVSQCERSNTDNRNGFSKCYDLLSKKTLHGVCLTGTSGKVCVSSGFPPRQYSKLEGSTSSKVEKAEAGSQSQSSFIAHANHPMCHHIPPLRHGQHCWGPAKRKLYKQSFKCCFCKVSSTGQVKVQHAQIPLLEQRNKSHFYCTEYTACYPVKRPKVKMWLILFKDATKEKRPFS